MNLWTEEKIAELVDMWPTGKSQNEMATRLGPEFTAGMVAGKLRRLGLRRPDEARSVLRGNPQNRKVLSRSARNRFSEAEDAYLRATAHLPVEEVARTLGRPVGSIGPRRMRIGIRVRDWTTEQETILREMVGQNIGQNRICARLKMGTERVRTKMKELGLRRIVTTSAVTDKQLADIYRLRRRGVSIARIALRLGISEWVVGEESRAMLAAEEESVPAQDEPFVARLLADGGMPRAVITPTGAMWIGPDNRPWFGPDRRVAA